MEKEKNFFNGQLNTRYKKVFVDAGNQVQTLGVLLLIVIFLSIRYPVFFTVLNLSNILRQQVPNLIVAIGITYLLILGEIDISIGGALALVIITVGKTINILGIFPAIILGILVGTFIGLVNSVLVVDGRIPSFIATLGMMYMTRSLAFVITQGYSIGDFPENFVKFYTRTIVKVPVVLIIVLFLYIIAFIVLTRSRYGRHLFAVGSDKNISSIMGISPNSIRRSSFLIIGFLIGIAGVLFASRLGAAQANTGRGFEFEVISAVIIGGASLYGGAGNVLNTIIGVFIIALIRNGLNLSHSNIYWQDFVMGFVIVLAVLLDTWRVRIRDRKLY
jgi:ribose transport system permease protein